jgi:S1-C subfamily serine protease
VSKTIPFISALIGGVVVAVVLLVTGVAGDGETKTVVGQAPLEAATSSAEDGALTPRDIYKRDAPGVVYITAEIVSTQPSPFVEPQRGESTGSGFIIGNGGSIVTNAHVVQGATSVTVRIGDGQVVKAKIAGEDPSTDLALLLVDPKGLDLHPLELGSSKAVEVGDPTVAIGNPFGLDRTLTTGVVSAKQRQIPSLLEGFQIDDVIQTDAAINPGNSGGPLIDALGRVIGVNSQIQTGGASNGNVGIGFAVPIDTAKEVIPQLRSKGRVDRAYLGVSTAATDPALDGANQVKGARILGVVPNSPADEGGLRRGDVIEKIGDTPIESSEQISAAVTKHKPGETVAIQIVRGGSKKTVEVRLATRPGLSASR